MSESSLEQEFEQFAALVRALEKTSEGDVASEIFQAIAASRTAVDGLKTLATYANEVKDVSKRGEFMKIIGELSLELAETQIRLAEKIRESDGFREQIINLQKEIENLKNPDTKLVIKNKLYYTPNGDGPFCTGCYDSNRKTIRVIELTGDFRDFGAYRCPICNNVYGES